MNFPGNYEHIGRIDPARLKQLVLELSEDQWQAFSVRRQRYEVHRETQTIGLVYDPDFRHSHATRLPTLGIFESALRPALAKAAAHYEEKPAGLELVKQYGPGYFVRATLVRLPAGCRIAEHQDLNFSLTHSHRIHLPVVTNESVFFTVGGETRVLEEGELVEINNRRMHAVTNRGSTDRIHFILDFVLPGEQCCCGRKLHPNTWCSPRACMETDRQRIPCTCYPES